VINKQIHEFPTTYANSNPIGRIALGWGVHTTVADECKRASIKKALIVTTGLKGTGIVDEINGVLKAGGISTDLYNKVTSNPKDYEVMEGNEVFKAAGCDGVVSVGGGSSHDCGKGIRIVACNNGAYICDLSAEVGDDARKKALNFKPVTIPQIAVNTTAGTGAESTNPAIIRNSKLRLKQGIMLPGGGSTTALIDPLLVRMLPQTFAAWTGWDALTHGFESFLSRSRSPYTRAIQLGTIKLVSENLREFTFNRMNHVACENICWAASMGAVGIGFGAGGGIVHGLGGGVGSLTDCHHGRNMAVTTPLEKYNEPACPEKFAEMARAMGVDTRGMTMMQAADKWFEEIERFLKDLNIQTGHLNEQFGVQKKDLEEIATRSKNGLTRMGNPRELGYEEAIKLLESLL
jgi:formaldehyde dismutase / methanol dehydrogenase